MRILFDDILVVVPSRIIRRWSTTTIPTRPELVPRRVSRRLRVALDIAVLVDAIRHCIGARKLSQVRIVVARPIVVQPAAGRIAILPGEALRCRHHPAGVAHAPIGAVELRPRRVATGRQRLGDAAQPIARQIADAAGVARRVQPNGHSARGVILDEAAAGGDFFDPTGQVVRMVATAAGDVLLDPLAGAVVEIPRLCRRVALRVLPMGEATLGAGGNRLCVRGLV